MLGHTLTKFIVTIFLIITVLITYYFQLTYLSDSDGKLFIYTSAAIVFPLAISGFLMWRASNRKQHLLASQFVKIAMVAAVLLPVIFNIYEL